MKSAVLTWEYKCCSHMQNYTVDLPTLRGISPSKLNMQKHQCHMFKNTQAVGPTLLSNLPFNSEAVKSLCLNTQKEKDYTEVMNNAIFSYRKDLCQQGNPDELQIA